MVARATNVLITAGSSGAGTFTIQVAMVLGATVAVTTRSDRKAEETGIVDRVGVPAPFLKARTPVATPEHPRLRVAFGHVIAPNAHDGA